MSPARLFRRRFTRAGAPPGEIAPAEDAAATTMRVLRFDADALEVCEAHTAADVEQAREAGGTLWLDVVGLRDAQLLQDLGEAFRVHPLAVADIANVGQRPKVELLDEGVTLLILRMASLDETDRLAWEQVSIVWGEGFVATFQERAGDCFDPVRDRLRAGRQRIRSSGADFLAVQLADAIVDGYFPLLEEFGERLESLEDEIVDAPTRESLARVYEVKRDLLILRRAVWPLRDALASLLREREGRVSRESAPYLRDVADHVMQAVDVTETHRELAASFIDVYLSSVGNRTNEAMRVLTVIATIFIPLTFFAGIYGMNFDTAQPLNMPELGWRHGYIAFWVVSLATAIGLLAMFRRLGWLGARVARRRNENRADAAARRLD